MTALLDIAQSKLLGGCIQKDWFQCSDRLGGETFSLAALAIVSCRVVLNVSPVSSMAAQLVGGYSAVCMDVSDDKEAVTVMYPSEPVLVEAAAQLLYNTSINDAPHPRLTFVIDTMIAIVRVSRPTFSLKCSEISRQCW